MPFDSLHPRAAFTICARNYMAQAKVLRRSFLDHHPDNDFFIVLVDRRDDAFAAAHAELDITWAEDLGIPNFAAHSLRFDVIELSTNVKAHCLGLLLQQHERVLYLDPDTWVMDSLDPVYGALDHATLVVTPAAMTPVLDGHRPDDIEFLRVGAFNLGFIGVRACDEAHRFLQWWSDRCLSDGFHETQSGVFVDQKWINLAPCYFEGVRILKDPGVNMAPWNLHERRLSPADAGWLVNGQARLRLFHFSSFDPHRPQDRGAHRHRGQRAERLRGQHAIGTAGDRCRVVRRAFSRHEGAAHLRKQRLQQRVHMPLDTGVGRRDVLGHMQRCNCHCQMGGWLRIELA